MSYAPFPLVWGFFGSGGGGGGPAFGVIQTDFGTYPTASGTSDVLTLVSADSARYYFTGTALTDTVTLTVTGLIPPGGSYGQILAKASGTNFDTEWRDGVQVTSVYNNSGATITKGSVVYINGASGNLPTIALSQANAESTSSKTYGLVVADISNMSSGSVVASGQIRDLNTFGVTEGVTLWLSPTTAGGYTTTKPTAPNHAVAVGVCTRAHPTLGTIEVKIQNGYELEELHNVSITSVADQQILHYESASSLWKNFTLLNSTTPQSITTANAAGSATTAARIDHTHKGVASFAINAGTSLYGDVTISAGSNITLTQVGNDIAIASTGGGGGSGTVTSVSVVSANGLAGTVANPTTTPAITLSTSVTGLLKGNGTAISAAVSGTDYEPPVTKGNLLVNGPLNISGGTGSVIGSNVTVGISQADAFNSGYLSSFDWNTFFNKEPALTKGNLTESTSSVLTITGGSNAVIGSGTSIQVKAVTTSQSGYFSSDDYKTFKTNENIKDADYSILTKFGLTSLTAVNSNSYNVSGTQVSVARQFTSGLIGKTPHILSQSVSSAGANCGYRIGSTTSLPYIAGGFKFSHFFQIADDAPVALARSFVGFNNINLALGINTTTNTDPFRSTFINFFGVGYDGFFGDTNLKLFHNGGTAGSTTVIDLGSGFSITAGADFYQVIFYNIPDSTDVYYEVIGWTSGNKASGVITTNLPYNLDLYGHTMRSNGGTAAVVKQRAASMHLYIGS